MESITTRKRKLIDIDIETLKWLSLKATEVETNLKSFIEQKLIEVAETIEEEELFNYLAKTDPKGLEMLNEEEQEDFNSWIGL